MGLFTGHSRKTFPRVAFSFAARAYDSSLHFWMRINLSGSAVSIVGCRYMENLAITSCRNADVPVKQVTITSK